MRPTAVRRRPKRQPGRRGDAGRSNRPARRRPPFTCPPPLCYSPDWPVVLDEGGIIPPREYRVNTQIRIREVLVIADDEEQLGILPVAEALALARERGLDLVEVAPNSSPPVCRLMDYGQFRYAQSKKEREARKGQRTNVLREVRFRTRIAEHDRGAKVKHVRSFLADGNKVKLTVLFRGREITRPDRGASLLRSVAEELKEVAKVESPPAMEGRRLHVILAPVPQRPQKTEQRTETEESPVGAEEAKAAQA